MEVHINTEVQISQFKKVFRSRAVWAGNLAFHQDFFSMKPLPQENLSLGVMREEHEAGHSSPSNIEVKMHGVKPPHCIPV